MSLQGGSAAVSGSWVFIQSMMAWWVSLSIGCRLWLGWNGIAEILNLLWNLLYLLLFFIVISLLYFLDSTCKRYHIVFVFV